MQTVTLKNGAEEALPLVTVTMMSLRTLMEQNPIVFYELVTKCRDSNHRFFGNTGDSLKQLGLVQAGEHIHDSVRNIVLSAVKGDGFDMSLGSPFKQ
jgi:hypothetical protein